MENIFRAYDIRGIMEKELTPEVMEKIGKAFGTVLGSKKKVVIGRDARLNGEALQNAVIAGLTATGIDVLDIGMVPTPVLNFYCKFIKADAGIIISASHNPKEYNGVRFRKGDGTGNTDCIPKVKELFFSEKFANPRKKGVLEAVKTEDVKKEYVGFVSGKIKPSQKICVVLDPGNGAACGVAEELFEIAGFEVIAINNNADGSFPGRGAEPNERTLMDLSQEVRINNACLGIAFDGDADRVVFVDENGVVRSAEESGSLIISELLKNKKGNVCINVDCSSMVEDVIRENGGTPVRIRVGDAFLADAIQLNDGIFAMESSDHFLIPEVLPSDDGIMVGLYVANIIAGSGKSFSSMLKHLKICPSEKINFKCEDKKKFEVIEKLRKDLEGKYPISTIDGLRLELAGGWALIRASNTTPTLRLTIEAKTLEQLEKIKQEFIPVIEKEIGENNG